MNQKDQHYLAKTKITRGNAPDLLYHFTTPTHYESIKTEGITKGVIPRSVTSYIQNCQWLTSNPDWYPPWAAGLSGNFVRTQIRIAVKIKNPRKLVHWLNFCHENVPIAMIHMLNQYDKAEEWYIYRGNIPTGWFVHVEHRPEGVVSKP